MGSPSKRAAVVFLFQFAVALIAGAESAEEKALGQFWAVHQQQPANDQAAVDAGQQFEKSFPQSSLLPVTSGITAWHLLKLGKVDAATTIFTAQLFANNGPIQKAAVDVSMNWLTRLDREKVRAALRTIYLSRVEYPVNLDALLTLPAASRPPMADRWGKSWTYNLTELKRISGVKAQAYLLESPTLGKSSDLREALKRPYAANVPLKPDRVMGGGAPGQPLIVQFVTTGANPKSIVLSAGTGDASASFVWAGEKLLVLTGAGDWLILPRPGG